MIHYDHIWRSPPKNLILLPNEIHVWRAFLDQRRFTVSRGLLRILLSGYMKLAPEKIQFHYNSHGKPALVEATGTILPHFNLSHAYELALYAFSSTQELGIDVEFIRPIAEAKQIAERFFSIEENAILLNLTPPDLHRHFFIYWTRKEAYLKAQGVGLAQIETGSRTDQQPTTQGTQENTQEATQWTVHDLAPAPGYVGALATQEWNSHMIYCQWTP